MALAIYIKDLQEMIIEELKSKDIEVKEIHCYKIAKKLYLFNIICIDRRLGELKLHKSAIKHIANNTEGYIPFKYLVHNDIYWSA
jgi:hypothetical protein